MALQSKSFITVGTYWFTMYRRPVSMQRVITLISIGHQRTPSASVKSMFKCCCVMNVNDCAMHFLPLFLSSCLFSLLLYLSISAPHPTLLLPPSRREMCSSLVCSPHRLTSVCPSHLAALLRSHLRRRASPPPFPSSPFSPLCTPPNPTNVTITSLHMVSSPFLR